MSALPGDKRHSSENDQARRRFALASGLAADGRIEEAHAEFAEAVQLAPHWPIARYQFGLLQFSSGRAVAALLTWAPLLNLDESSGFPHFVRGFDALARDDFAQAKSHFRTGLAIQSDNPAVAGDIEKILARIDHLEAGATVTEAEREEPSHVLVANYGRFGDLH